MKGARVLVVEDEFIILMELESILVDAGAQVVGPCRTVKAALALANDAEIDAALLDIRLGQETIAPVARCLARRGIPFAFYSGQTEIDPALAEWPECEIVTKPAIPKMIVGALARLLRQG